MQDEGKSAEQFENVMLEMFEQRGYNNIEKHEDRITGIDKGGVAVSIFTEIIEKLNIAVLQNVISEMEADNNSHIILVYKGVPTPAVTNTIGNAKSIGKIIEIFPADDLQYNPTKHILQPKFELLDKEIQKEYKNKYIKNGNGIFPCMLKTDPIAKFLDLQKGEIVKVVRKESVSFRMVK